MNHAIHEAMPPVSSRIAISALDADERAQVLSLYARVFGSVLSVSKWQSLFERNPFSPAIVYVAKTTDRQVVGHYAVIPQPLRLAGEKALGALAVHLMVHPSFQRQGILKALALAVERRMQIDGIDVGMTFLNDNSLHAHIRHFGWSPLGGRNPIFFKVLRWASLFAFGRRTARAFDDPCRAGATIREVDALDERVDALWEGMAPHVGVAVERSARYLNWRLAPGRDRYRIHIAEDASKRLTGVVVTKKERRFGVEVGFLVELLFAVDDEDTGVALARYAQALLVAEGCAMATALTAGSPAVERALRRTGFRRLPRRLMPHGIHFCFKGVGLRSGAPGPAPWFLSWLDHDVV